MIANGWEQHMDTSEYGDSMVVYRKKNEEGSFRFIGVRINDLKDHRNMTIILYPKNIVVPVLQAPSKVQAQQQQTTDALKEAMKKAMEDKAKAEKEAAKGKKSH